MNRTLLTLMLAATVAASIGCTTKNYVREQTTPLINKTNELDDLTAKNSKDIKDVDQRAQAGIQGVQAQAAAADQKAIAANSEADKAQLSANGAAVAGMPVMIAVSPAFGVNASNPARRAPVPAATTSQR